MWLILTPIVFFINIISFTLQVLQPVDTFDLFNYKQLLIMNMYFDDNYPIIYTKVNSE